MKRFLLSNVLILLVAVGGSASAATTKWNANFMATTPFAGINDVHFEWVVSGGNNVVDASPLMNSMVFGGTNWTTISDDDIASTTFGSLNLVGPTIDTGTKLSFNFSIIASGGDIPAFTKAYWTRNGYGEDDNLYQLTLADLQFVAEVPLPAAFPLLLAAFGGLGFFARRRKAT